MKTFGQPSVRHHKRYINIIYPHIRLYFRHQVHDGVNGCATHPVATGLHVHVLVCTHSYSINYLPGEFSEYDELTLQACCLNCEAVAYKRLWVFKWALSSSSRWLSK